MKALRGGRREFARNLIAEKLPKYREVFPEKSDAEILSIISREEYPFGPRQYNPYKVWLSEIRYWKSRGEEKQKEKEIPKEQLSLFKNNENRNSHNWNHKNSERKRAI